MKGLTLDASVGISQASVVESDAKLEERVRFVHESLDSHALVERYYDAFSEARRHLDAVSRASPTGAGRSNLMHWTMLHSALLILGYLRKRSIINRNSSAHPGWGESLEVAAARF